MKNLITISTALFLLFTFLVGCDDGVSSTEVQDVDNFVDASWLNDNVDNNNVTIIDARGAASTFIPGAIITKWQNFANMSVTTKEVGFGELLSAIEIGAQIAALGIEAADTVIVYAGAGAGWGEAGRIAWMLQMAGIKAQVLSGGIKAWTDAGYATVSSPATPIPSSFTLSELDVSMTISTDYLNTNKSSIVILDTRSKPEFDGDTSAYGSLDDFTHGGWGEKAFGHIPGAKHTPYTDLFQADGTLKSVSDLQALVTSWGLNDKSAVIAPYCTGGIRSAYMTLVLRELGYINCKNYDASFYGWTAADLSVE